LEDRENKTIDLNRLVTKLKTDVTITAPAWAFAAAALVALVLLGVALD
jgi:hypothetical protein